MRFDLAVIADWIEPKATVLDLGCGPGELLAHLRAVKEVVGTGIEKDEDEVATAIGRGLTVIQGDMNEEIRDYPDKSFDYVILSQTLMQVFDPARIIGEMIRVGRYGIVSFPNFGHWRCRAQLFFRGRAPVTRELPYQWYDTPNIRVIAYADFTRFCRTFGFKVLNEAAVRERAGGGSGARVTRLKNLLATHGVFMLAR